MGLSVHQTSQHLLREVLLAVVQSEHDGGGGISSVPCRASAALYALLGDHPVDRRGRCRCCRSPRVLRGRGRRVCRVLVAARFYLDQSDDVLLCRLGSELGESAPAAQFDAADPGGDGATEVLPRVVSDSIDPRIQRSHAPAVSPPPAPGGSPRARRPDPDHGEQETSPSQDRPLVVAEGATWQA